MTGDAGDLPTDVEHLGRVHGVMTLHKRYFLGCYPSVSVSGDLRYGTARVLALPFPKLTKPRLGVG